MDSCKTCKYKNLEPDQHPCNEAKQEHVTNDEGQIIDFRCTRWEDDNNDSR